MALKGLKALKVLKERKTFKFSFSSINKEKTETFKKRPDEVIKGLHCAKHKLYLYSQTLL